MEHDTEDLD